MSWTDLEERIAAKSRFDASVRLYQRSASSLPALIIALRKTIMCDLKWKPTDTFGLALGKDENEGKVRIIRRKEKAIAKPRQMKTGSLTFDFGHVASLGERGTLKSETAAKIVDADTVEVTLPTFDYEDEAEAVEEPSDEGRGGPPPQPRAPVVARPNAKPPMLRRDDPPVTIAGITISFDQDGESVTYRGKSMEVTDRQAQFVATLAKAMPQPVGREFVTKKLFNGSVPATAAMVIDHIAMDLTKALPGIGLQLKNMKGIGFALQEAA